MGMRTSKTHSEQMLDIRNKYTSKNGHEYTIDELVDFALTNHLWEIDVAGTKQQLATQLRRALDSEEITDPQGRRVRRNYAAKVNRHGRNYYLWTDMAHATRDHMKVAFHDNRRRIFGFVLRLDEYKESFNENYNTGDPIQMSFDFTKDLQEAKLVQDRAKSKTTRSVASSVSVPPPRRFPVAARGTASRRVLSRP